MDQTSSQTETPSKKLPKTKILIALVLIALVLPVVFISTQIPFGQISLLKSGFVKVDYDQKSQTPTYQFTAEKPQGWVSLKNISQHVQDSVVISEDWAFFQHQGVDVNQLKKAVDDHLSDGKRLRGASTLSQQLVKNLFLDHDRSFIRKGRELIITVAMEKQLSKEKILEVYLNVVEFGEGVYGVDQASRKYFKKSAKNLNAKEAAFLAMLLPNPKRYAVSFEERALTEYAAKTVGDILEKRKSVGQLSEEQMRKELARKLNFERSAVKKKSSTPKTNSLTTLKRPTSFDDGSNFEKRYERDEDLVFNSAAAFDPRSLEAVELDEEVEFSLE